MASEPTHANSEGASGDCARSKTMNGGVAKAKPAAMTGEALASYDIDAADDDRRPCRPDDHMIDAAGAQDMPDEELLYDLADLFKVFADTTRIKILYALMGRELAVGDIADIIGATQSAVSHQLRTLKQAHLVKFQRDGKNVIYSLSDDHVYTMLAQGMTHICE